MTLLDRISELPADLYLASGLGLLAYHVAGLFENNWGDSHVRALALFLLALPFSLRYLRTEH